MSRLRVWSITPLAGFFLVFLLAIPFHMRPENFIVDDGYFYPQIARHIASGHGSTFNGIMLTNGYHPLWMLVSVAAAVVTKNAVYLVQLLGFVQDVLLALTVAALLCIARRASMRGAFLACFAFLFFNVVLGAWRLMESPLALLLQVVVLLLTFPLLPESYRRLRRFRPVLLGIALGCTVLARLDLVFFAAIVLGYLLVASPDANNWNVRVTQVMVASVVTTAIVAPYLVWNWRNFHHFLPISGAIKSTFPHVQHWGIQGFVWPVVLSILWAVGIAFRRHKTDLEKAYLLTAAAATLHLMYTLSFGEVAPWYLTTGYLSVTLGILWAVDWLLRYQPGLQRLELPLEGAVCLLFLAVGGLRSVSNLTVTRIAHGAFHLRGAYHEPKRAFAEQLARSFPAGTRMFIFDAPGGVALYSGMAVLPVDGLVGDYAYSTALTKSGVDAYAAAHGIRYFIGPVVPEGKNYDRLFLRGYATPSGQAFEVKAPLTRQPAGTVDLPFDRRVMLFREINPEMEASFPQIGVWRLPLSRQAE